MCTSGSYIYLYANSQSFRCYSTCDLANFPPIRNLNLEFGISIGNMSNDDDFVGFENNLRREIFCEFLIL